MIVNRHSDNERAPVMTIYLRKNPFASTTSTPSEAPAPFIQPASSRTDLSKAAAPTADERIVTIDMQNKHSSHILEFFMAETRAIVLQPTPEDISEMQQLEALNKQGRVDRERMKRLREEKKQEEDMLKRARAIAGVSEEDQA
jgi:large subunit ribosomal protein MRP49